MNESREIKKAAIFPENASFDYGFENGSNYGGGRYETEYIYDRTDVRIIFITLYTLVFCSCLFGNLMVILVVTLSRRLRSTTNFFLANLAVADLCVGIFCVFQNLTIYLIPSWIFGEFLCKMYQFVHSLSYTASIFILVVICTERYLAIIHPIRCKQILTPTRLRLAIGLVWITSTIYSSPRFFYVKTIENHLNEGGSETICILPRTKYNSQLFDMINFVLLYLIPLCVMTVLYTLIAVRLWNSSLGYPPLQRCKKGKSGSSSGGKGTDEPVRIKFEKRRSNTTEDEGRVSIDGDGNRIRSGGGGVASAVSYRVSSSRNVLRARRGVIRMLIIVVLTFGLCNLPIHARKIWQYWSEEYQGASTFSSLFTPLTFLVTYCNSAINPLLYAFLSRNFQKGMKELSLWDCCTRKSGARGPSLNRHDSSFRRRSYRGCSISDHDR